MSNEEKPQWLEEFLDKLIGNLKSTDEEDHESTGGWPDGKYPDLAKHARDRVATEFCGVCAGEETYLCILQAFINEIERLRMIDQNLRNTILDLQCQIPFPVFDK